MSDAREAAHAVAEAAQREIRQVLPDSEHGYDLEEQPDGGILIRLGHDVVLYVDKHGDEMPVPTRLLLR